MLDALEGERLPFVRPAAGRARRASPRVRSHMHRMRSYVLRRVPLFKRVLAHTPAARVWSWPRDGVQKRVDRRRRRGDRNGVRATRAAIAWRVARGKPWRPTHCWIMGAQLALALINSLKRPRFSASNDISLNVTNRMNQGRGQFCFPSGIPTSGDLRHALRGVAWETGGHVSAALPQLYPLCRVVPQQCIAGRQMFWAVGA